MDIPFDYILRIYLGVFFTCIAIFYSLRLLLSQHKGPLTFIGKTGTRHFWGHLTFRVFRILIWGVCVVRVFYPDTDAYLMICSYLNILPINLLGAGLMTFGFGFVLYSHQSMGHHWRLGIDPQGSDSLVTQGIFSRTRNPVFLGVMAGQLGFFLALPSVFSAVCLLLGVVAIFSQVDIEENYLRQKWGKTYETYCQQVPRWL
ncbi:isoprenylcysteine carboxylmethyltransferase family protein [Aliikangiella marina]|uniref:Isoprenylcysteine carboxylmethyltransferase family protein n=1 Tax=Aliikangiella marina TaxID=1712262 RepID=A0A545T7D1_9GAMM|nr:isoprenylcysteine carboxylmethyltransferase family protein [Aliikangiella marina]TQV73134.1 isoprenylcysteine carboxylmethyltransferase family protein [Aliikangiella marina]